jgi:hypothetical protein
MANQVEAHERRWSLRIFGLPAPTTTPEKLPQSKDALLKFLAEDLQITNILPADIDTAHRLGEVIDHKQTLLVRFFRREIPEFILSSKSMLKGKVSSIFEDTTYRNRCLIWDLSQRPEVERAWNMGGVIWAKLHNRTRKMKVEITDDLDEVLNRPPGTPSLSGRRKRQKQQRPRKNRKNSTSNRPLTVPNGIDQGTLAEPAEIPDVPADETLTSLPITENPGFNEDNVNEGDPTTLVIHTNVNTETPDETLSAELL